MNGWMDGWIAEVVFTHQKLTFEFEVRCRHSYYNVSWQRDREGQPRARAAKGVGTREGFSEKGPPALGAGD